jgi:hypothetical protein
MRHVDAWIQTMVNYRDKVIHYSEIPGFVPMSAELIASDPCFSRASIVQPALPCGVLVADYGYYLKDRIKQFVSETVILLPDLRQDLIDPDRLFNVPAPPPRPQVE